MESETRRYDPGPHATSDSNRSNVTPRRLAAEISRDDATVVVALSSPVLSKTGCTGNPVEDGLCVCVVVCVVVCVPDGDRVSDCDWDGVSDGD